MRKTIALARQADNSKRLAKSRVTKREEKAGNAFTARSLKRGNGFLGILEGGEQIQQSYHL